MRIAVPKILVGRDPITHELLQLFGFGKAALVLAREDQLAVESHFEHTALPRNESDLAELLLDESGYTAMWQADKSPQSQTRLENLKELVRFMHDFDTLQGFLEHVSLAMDADQGNDGVSVAHSVIHCSTALSSSGFGQTAPPIGLPGQPCGMGTPEMPGVPSIFCIR